MMFYNLSLVLIFIDMMFMVLLSVAFFTLLERKVLGYIQLRKGPNKVGFMGLLQPFSDALKLFSKEMTIILKSNYFLFLISPMLSMFLMISLWFNMPILFNLLNSLFNLLMILCLMSIGVYGLMIAGWSSNSLYSLIGGLRSIAQTISYEVSMILILMSIFIMIESFNLFNLINYQYLVWFMFLMFMNMLILFVSFLAELNRTPFDFSEGESELVSGFNTEYMSGSFAMIFIAEYGMIMFLMMLFNFLYFGANFFTLKFYLIYMFFLFLVIWIRGTFPRFRYDNLMYLTWKSYLMISLFYIIMILGLKLFI